jgi:uncharacterized OB-fold protein
MRLPERLAVLDFPGAAADARLVPVPTADVAPFEAGLADRVLRLQACTGCGRVRFPVAPVCPYCAGGDAEWREVDGRGRVHSWVRYHRAFVPEFEPLVPYSVLCVELDAGVRLFGRFAAQATPGLGQRVQAAAERWPEGRFVLAFAPAGGPG